MENKVDERVKIYPDSDFEMKRHTPFHLSFIVEPGKDSEYDLKIINTSDKNVSMKKQSNLNRSQSRLNPMLGSILLQVLDYLLWGKRRKSA